MASIPNLNTLRTGRGGPRRRPRDVPADTEDGDSASSLDEIIQQTDVDAGNSRMSTVALGYLDDEFARPFFPPGQEIPKRYPIINRGTYVRTTAIDKLVVRFLKTRPKQRKQIVSLGAGSDTRYFRLRFLGAVDEHSQVHYHELDFKENVDRKRHVIRNNPKLADLAYNTRENGWTYQLDSLDLRDLIKKSPPSLPGLEHDVPTLLLSECCLCYLPPDAATSVIQYFTMNITNSLALILYEPIRPFDPFGKTMVSNLSSRGIHMQTLKRFSTLHAQRERLRLAGFDGGQGARDVHQLWESEEWVSREERERVEKLEWLDEVEEWKLLASHYCVAWGWRGEVFGEAWDALTGAWSTVEQKDSEMG